MKIKNLIIGIMLLVLLVSFVSAQSWGSYGNGYTPLWHETYESELGRFDLGTSNTSIAEGYSVGGDVVGIPFQPLVWHFNYTENFVVIANDNYIEIYDENLDFVYEVFSDLAVSQIDVADFSVGDGFMSEVVGIFEFNDTSVSFKSFEYNATSNTFNLTIEYQIIVNADKKVNGLRCSGGSGGECYFTITESGSTTFYIANETDLTSVALPLLNGTPIEPVGWWDFDNDGRTEFFIYSNYSLMLFEKDGSIDVLINASSGKSFEGALIFQPDNTGFWRYAVLERTDTSNYPVLKIVVYKSDGSVYWSTTLISTSLPFSTGGSTYWAFGRLAIDDDYDGDGYDDIYVVAFKNGKDSGSDVGNYVFKVFKGYNGNELSSISEDFFHFSTNQLRDEDYLAIGDMNGDGVREFIYLNHYNYISDYKELDVYNPVTETKIFSWRFSGATLYSPYSCIPADLTYDGFLDIVCSGEDGTMLVISGGTNQNAEIVSVAYVPSTSIPVNTTLFAYVTATDNEGDFPLYYGVKCSNSESWTADNTSYVTSCFYGSVGTYNHSVRVRDVYHSDYDIFSQSIFVTPTGEICDNDGICEAGQGENYINCPNDCPVPNTTTSSVSGSMTLPTELVDTENINMGLLPEIYYGTLGFMSSVLSPLIVLVFLFLFVMIIITIGLIIKKIAIKVSNAGK